MFCRWHGRVEGHHIHSNTHTSTRTDTRTVFFFFWAGGGFREKNRCDEVATEVYHDKPWTRTLQGGVVWCGALSRSVVPPLLPAPPTTFPVSLRQGPTHEERPNCYSCFSPWSRLLLPFSSGCVHCCGVLTLLLFYFIFLVSSFTLLSPLAPRCSFPRLCTTSLRMKSPSRPPLTSGVIQNHYFRSNFALRHFCPPPLSSSLCVSLVACLSVSSLPSRCSAPLPLLLLLPLPFLTSLSHTPSPSPSHFRRFSVLGSFSLHPVSRAVALLPLSSCSCERSAVVRCGCAAARAVVSVSTLRRERRHNGGAKTEGEGCACKEDGNMTDRQMEGHFSDDGEGGGGVGGGKG